jgi:Ca2+-binding EF-hand superfamily protein
LTKVLKVFFFFIQNPTESEVKKLVVEHRADDRVTFEVFLPIMQVYAVTSVEVGLISIIAGNLLKKIN